VVNEGEGKSKEKDKKASIISFKIEVKQIRSVLLASIPSFDKLYLDQIQE
jgi:hypothetical protein